MQIPTTAAQATAFTQDQVASQVGTAVAAKVLQADRQQGDAVLALLSAAVGRPSTTDVNGVGGHVDAVA